MFRFSCESCRTCFGRSDCAVNSTQQAHAEINTRNTAFDFSSALRVHFNSFQSGEELGDALGSCGVPKKSPPLRFRHNRVIITLSRYLASTIDQTYPLTR